MALQEREYKVDGELIKADIDFSKETIRVRGNGVDRVFTFSHYLKFPGNMEEFVKQKVFPNGH